MAGALVGADDFLVGAVGIHDRETAFGRSGSERHVGDFLAVWAPGGVAIEDTVFGELLFVFAVGVANEDLPGVVGGHVGMGDLFSIGGPDGIDVAPRIVGLRQVAHILAVCIHEKDTEVAGAG